MLLFIYKQIVVEGTKAGVIIALLKEDLAIASWNYAYWSDAFRALSALTKTDLENIASNHLVTLYVLTFVKDQMLYILTISYITIIHR